MPAISRFYGIVIAMYHDDHPVPHFHARHGEHDAQVGIDPFEVIAGSLPAAQLRHVKRWADLHRGELLADWDLAASNEPPMKIEPLS
jgi:hypothetical protein